MKLLFSLLAILASNSAFADSIDFDSLSDEMVVNFAHADMIGHCKSSFDAGTTHVSVILNGAYYFKDNSPDLSVHDAAVVLREYVKLGVCRI
ncbi:MAG: hypothetical protein ACXVB9_06710 [Bdellovibrionota bacterium]